jgi:hypothetical protein
MTWLEVPCKHDYLCMCYPIFRLNVFITYIIFSIQADSEPKLTETEKKKLSLQEIRRSLPIFPFRDDLIQAIKDHQVSPCDGVAFLVSILMYTSWNFKQQVSLKLWN